MELRSRTSNFDLPSSGPKAKTQKMKKTICFTKTNSVAGGAWCGFGGGEGRRKPDLKVPTSKFKDGTSNPNFNVQCSPPPSSHNTTPHCLFLQFFPFFSLRQTSKPDFKVPTSKFEDVALKSRTSNISRKSLVGPILVWPTPTLAKPSFRQTHDHLAKPSLAKPSLANTKFQIKRSDGGRVRVRGGPRDPELGGLRTRRGSPEHRRAGPRRVGTRRVAPARWGPVRWATEGPKGWRPRVMGARRVGARNFALFFPLPPQFFFLSSLSWGSSRGILGLSCEAPAVPKLQPESPNVDI